LEWAIGENYILTNIAYDSDGAESSADVIWPDNPGVVGGACLPSFQKTQQFRT
jgi:hypothetical protein